MSEIIQAGAALAALLMAYPLVVLSDLRHEPPAPAPRQDRGGMTAAGVPYVAGR